VEPATALRALLAPCCGTLGDLGLGEVLWVRFVLNSSDNILNLEALDLVEVILAVDMATRLITITEATLLVEAGIP
jgi:hypothetical protein